MNKFLEQLEILKTTFSELPEECLIEAIEKMDQTVEQLSHSVVFVEGDPQADYLADMGKDVVQDFLNPADFNFFSSVPSTSSNDFNFPSTDIPQTATTPLYCYTCGEGFNNRKALYRHGKATNHSTRPSRCHREVNHSEVPGEEIQKTLGIQTSLDLDSDQRRPVENLNNLMGPSDISLASLHLGTEDFLESTSFLENSDDGESNISCFECKRVFTNRKALYRHGQQTNHRLRLRRATKVKGGPIRCTKCKYSTDKSMNFRAHLRRNHNESHRDNVF